MTIWRTTAILLISALTVAGSPEEEPFRLWRYDRGSVKARFIKTVRSTVVLEREDGKRIVLSRRLLSPDDQTYLNSLAPEATPSGPDAPETEDERPDTPIAVSAAPPPLHATAPTFDRDAAPAQPMPPPFPSSTSMPEVAAATVPESEPAVSWTRSGARSWRSAARRSRASVRDAWKLLRAPERRPGSAVTLWVRDKIYLALTITPLTALLAALFLQIACQRITRLDPGFRKAYLVCLLGKYIGGGVCLAWTYAPSLISGVSGSVGFHATALPAAFLAVSVFLALFLKGAEGRTIGLGRGVLVLGMTSAMLFTAGMAMWLLLCLAAAV